MANFIGHRKILNTFPLMFCASRSSVRQCGVTLIELIVFLLVISIALVTIIKMLGIGVSQSIDPLIRIRGLELAQSQLDEILSKKFDENTPSGGIPACGSTGGAVCQGISPESDFDDVGDYHGFLQNIDGGYTLLISVVDAGTDLALLNDQARLISVTVSLPDLSDVSGSSISLSAYKVNF